MARPDLLKKTRGFGINWNPVTSVSGAIASLKAKGLIDQRRKINADVRDSTMAFLEKKGFKTIPSVSNKFMVDTRRPTVQARESLRKELVYVGPPLAEPSDAYPRDGGHGGRDEEIPGRLHQELRVNTG